MIVWSLPILSMDLSCSSTICYLYGPTIANVFFNYHSLVVDQLSTSIPRMASNIVMVVRNNLWSKVSTSMNMTVEDHKNNTGQMSKTRSPHQSYQCLMLLPSRRFPSGRTGLVTTGKTLSEEIFCPVLLSLPLWVL